MALLPAAMFSMFFFLSLFIQNVMGYSPLKAGFAFLPFSICIIIAATIVSNLIALYKALGGGWEKPEPAQQASTAPAPVPTTQPQSGDKL